MKEIIIRINRTNPPGSEPTYSYYCMASDSWGERSEATIFDTHGFALNMLMNKLSEASHGGVLLVSADNPIY